MAEPPIEHHHPGVPNLGDIAAVDWSTVEPVDVLTGGFPCQDVSSAGRRLGLRPGTRSGLWSHFAYAIDRLRPSLVVVENVRGLLSATAESPCDVEPCPWCVGEHPDRPLRALGAVLGDLADLGYDASWCGVRASDAGAPHARFRVFVVAWPASDAGCGELQRRGVGGVLDRMAGPGEGEGQERQRDRDTAGDGGAADADAEGQRRREGRPEPAGIFGGPDAALGSDAPARHSASSGRDAAQPADRRGEPSGATGGPGVPTADAVRDGREGHTKRDLRSQAEQSAPLGRDAAGRVLDWGAYEPAIRRWELILGRPAPAPTMTSARGGQQLSPAFVEWLMGLPAGHVTDVPGLSRNEQLKMLGNGVVPAQAELALHWLLGAEITAAAA